MKKVYLLHAFAALTVALVLASCHKDELEQEPTEAEAITIAEEVLDLTIDPNQDWNMTQSGSIDVTANAGINANEVLILDAFPYGGKRANIIGQATVQEGQTVTVNYVAPKSVTTIYVACRNAQKQYRVKSATVGTQSISFRNSSGTRGAHRVQAQTVENPSKSEIGYSFNAQMSQAWDKYNHSGIKHNNTEQNYSAWNRTTWNDKFYQINATITPSGKTQTDLDDIANLIINNAVPEGENNIEKAAYTGYSVITTGEPVTMTPIFRNSSSGGKLGYYYYPVGHKPSVEELKTKDKYIVCELGDKTQGNNHVYPYTYNLVYFDESGNASYTFPENYVIEFFIQNTANNGSAEVFDGDGEWSRGDLKDYFTLTNGKDVGVHDGWSTGNASGSKQWMNNSYIQFGVEGDPTVFSTPATDSNSQMEYFKVVTNGNRNGHFNDGTVYKIKPYQDGVLEVALQIPYTIEIWQSTEGETNQSNAFKIKEYTRPDGVPIRTSFEFPVKANLQYTVLQPGRPLGFYGYALFGINSSPVTKSIAITPECYGDGELNNDIHKFPFWSRSENNLSHTAVFSVNGNNYLGFEDWNDMDYNDVIFEITGTTGGEEIVPDDPVHPVYSYAFEDSHNCDYDMNDVVLKVREDGDDIVLKLVATGATLDLQLRLYKNEGDDGMSYSKSYTLLSYNNTTEVHEMLGAMHGYMINTNADNGKGANASPIEIRVPKAEYADYRKLRLAVFVPSQKGKEEYEMRLSGSGSAPYGVIIPADWKWPREWVNVKNAYSQFEGFATTVGANEDWYLTPNTGAVMDENELY